METTRYEDRELVIACCRGDRADMLRILSRKTPKNHSVQVMCDHAINGGLTEEMVTRARGSVYNRFIRELDVCFADVHGKAEARYAMYLRDGLYDKAEELRGSLDAFANRGRLF